MTAELTPLSPGVARVSWVQVSTGPASGPDSGPDSGPGSGPAEAIKAAISEGFAGGLHRIEAHVATDDIANQRAATFAGLRKEGVARGVADGADRVVYARLATDAPVETGDGFRALLNSFLPRKRAISQLLVRDEDDRVLLCQLTYKRDWDLPGGVVEVGESPRLAVSREVQEELSLSIDAGRLLLTDWLPPWRGWDDAVCLVFDGGVHEPGLVDAIVRDGREIKSAAFVSLDELDDLCADFTARRIRSAYANLAGGPAYVESGG